MAITDPAPGLDCARPHILQAAGFDPASATPGSFALMPHDDMVDQLRNNYRAI